VSGQLGFAEIFVPVQQMRAAFDVHSPCARLPCGADALTVSVASLFERATRGTQMPHADKVLVTNGAALRAKYGEAFDVAAALKPLLKADRDRGLQSQWFDLADPAAMRTVRATAVADPVDQVKTKKAIDKVFGALRPDYLVIVGSVDVVPHQDMTNPVPADDDPYAAGDLPYACEAGHGTDPSSFRGPTRVVGRLADETGATKPTVLNKVIRVAAKARTRPRRAYDAHLAISAEVWRDSTQLSIRNTFGSDKDLKLSPTRGPKWTKEQARRRAHFINCHGASVDPCFYGQRGNDYPSAHDSSWLEGRIAEGTVAVAECCYGAELYDPSAAGGNRPIVSAYAAQGAYGFVGSTTIAYGPAQGNGSADLLCQFFLQRVLAGASLGRAFLEARQRFVRDTNVLDPADLKTLAQFNLIGDPSIVAVQKPGKQASTPPAKSRASGAGARGARRANLMAMGVALESSRSYVEAKPADRRPPRLTSLKRELGLKHPKVSSFDVQQPSALRNAKGAPVAGPEAIHLLVEPIESALPAQEYRLVVAAERSGEVVSVRDLRSR